MARAHGDYVEIDDPKYPGLRRYFVKIADLSVGTRPTLFPAQTGKRLRAINGRLSQSATGTVNAYDGDGSDEIAYNKVPGGAVWSITWFEDRIQTTSGNGAEVDSAEAIALDGFVDVAPV